MRKKVLVMVLTVGMTISLIVCGAGVKDNSNAAEDGFVKVPGIYVTVDNASDKFLSESTARRAEIAAERLGYKAKIIKYGENETKFLPALKNIPDSGWDIIVATGYVPKEGIESMAKEYSNQKYMLLDQRVDDGFSNVCSADCRGDESAFLSGTLAVMTTVASQDELAYTNKNKVVGFVGSMDMTLINDFTAGFIQSARFINPEIEVITSYTNSFTDAAKGKELAKIMYDSGCDMVYSGAGGADMECLEAGKEASKCSIGTDFDQALLFGGDPNRANLILTSQLKCLDENIIRVVEKYTAGEEISGKNGTLGLIEGMIRLVDNDYHKTNVPEWMRDKILELTEMIKNGEIKADMAYGMEDADVESIIDDARP